MGRKDAQMPSLPVDNYRKQIGHQNGGWSRAGIVVGTAGFVMLFNLMFFLPNANQDNCQDYYMERSLAGPPAQDDPDLLQWVRRKVVPPSRLPYNLSYFLSGLHQESATSPAYSPSQEFILGTLEEIYGEKIQQPGTFLEAGAYDGEFLSNTLYLEHEFRWHGILVEANPLFFNQLLLKRRKSWAVNVCLNIKPYPSQMGRKDAQMPSLPVDNYRKQIGKQNKKQNTTTVKDLKKHTETKSSSYKVYQDIKMVVGGFAAVVILVYCLLFLWLYDQKNAK